MKSKLLFLIFLALVVVLLPSKADANVLCWRTNMCLPTSDGDVCDGGSFADYFCQFDGVCVPDSPFERYCNGVYCGDIFRAQCNPPPEPTPTPTPTPPPTCCGSLTVTTNNGGVSWCINHGVGCGSGTSAFYGGLTYNTYSISITSPGGFDCNPDAWSRQINAVNPDKGFDITCVSTGPPAPTVNLSWGGSNGVVTVPFGSSGTLNWVTQNQINSCTGSSTAGDFSGSKAFPVGAEAKGPITSDRTYTLTCTGPGGTAAGSVTVQIVQNPTGTITAIPNPTTTRLTSSGQANGTISGTAQAFGANVSSVWIVIREWNGVGTIGACDTNNRDWTGAGWGPACGGALTPTYTPNVPSTNWSYSSTPTTVQMTSGRSYRVYLAVVDSLGRWNNFDVFATTLYQAPQPPTASLVKVTEPDYCLVGPALVTLSWVYTDPDSTDQSSVRIQIDDNAGFANPNYDTQKTAMTCTSGATCSWSVPGSANITWGTVYRVRVMVWDGTDIASGWIDQSRCIGPIDTGSGDPNPSQCTMDPNDNETSWKSPQNQYPTGVSTFTWTPNKPQIGELVQFNHGTSQCFKTPPNTPDLCNRWDWYFGDGTTVNMQDPTHVYADFGIYSVKLKLTDTMNGYHCTLSKPLNIQKPIPKWIEVFPR